MNKKSIVVVLFALFAVSLAASPAYERVMEVNQEALRKGRIVLQTSFGREGEPSLLYIATNKQIGGSPQWDGSSDPPLNLMDAIAIARKELDETNVLGESFELWVAVVKRVDSSSHKNRWCYDISFRRTDGKHQDVSVVVLMDATVIKPTKVH